MSQLSIIIPHVPGPAMRPNGRAHHMVKHKATKEARRIAAWSAKAAHIDAGRPSFTRDRPLTIAYTMYWPKGAKRLDQDNAVASIKAYTDGISDALTEGYDGTYTVTVIQDRDRTGDGFTQVVITQEA